MRRSVQRWEYGKIRVTTDGDQDHGDHPDGVAVGVVRIHIPAGLDLECQRPGAELLVGAAGGHTRHRRGPARAPPRRPADRRLPLPRRRTDLAYPRIVLAVEARFLAGSSLR